MPPPSFKGRKELKSLAQMEQSCQKTLAPKCKTGGTGDIPHHSLFNGLSVDLYVLGGKAEEWKSLTTVGKDKKLLISNN